MGSLPTKAGAMAVAIEPKLPKRVYVVSEAGVYRSVDAGQSWTRADRGLPRGKIVALAIDPLHPQRLYSATAAGDIYASEDGARTWHGVGSLRRS